MVRARLSSTEFYTPRVWSPDQPGNLLLAFSRRK
jgi:hypothetical protein